MSDGQAVLEARVFRVYCRGRDTLDEEGEKVVSQVRSFFQNPRVHLSILTHILQTKIT